MLGCRLHILDTRGFGACVPSLPDCDALGCARYGKGNLRVMCRDRNSTAITENMPSSRVFAHGKFFPFMRLPHGRAQGLAQPKRTRQSPVEVRSRNRRSWRRRTDPTLPDRAGRAGLPGAGCSALLCRVGLVGFAFGLPSQLTLQVGAVLLLRLARSLGVFGGHRRTRFLQEVTEYSARDERVVGSFAFPPVGFWFNLDV